MTPDRWREVERLYHAAAGATGRRARGVSGEACAGDEALRREVESLLAQPRRPTASSTQPALAVAARSSAMPAAPLLSVRRLGPYHDCRRRSAPAGWARSTARATRSWVATSRSRSCRGVHGRPGAAGALRARGARARLAESSAHRRDLRPRRARTASRRSCWNWSRGRRWPSASRAGRRLPLDEALADRAADRRGARGGAREGHRPSRPEAGQHQDHARRRGEGARLRAGQGVGPTAAIARRRTVADDRPSATRARA